MSSNRIIQGEIRPSGINPRNINKKNRGRLKESLGQLGDLGVITIDADTGEVISGNQRDRVIEIKYEDIEWLKTWDRPLSSGTIGIGIVTHEGEPFTVRAVKYPSEDLKKVAMLRANGTYGEWDLDMLANEFDEDILLTGYLDPEKILKMSDDPNDVLGEDADEHKEFSAGVQPLLLFRLYNIEDLDNLYDLLKNFLQEQGKLHLVEIEKHGYKVAEELDVDAMLEEL